MRGSSLTLMERRIAGECQFDLGAGYPVGLTPAWVWELSVSKPDASEHGDLFEAVRMRLELPRTSIHVTFSGSVALQRSLLAARSFLRDRLREVVFIVPDPCIDIIPRMAKELTNGTVQRVEIAVKPFFTEEDCDVLCSRIKSASERGCGAVVAIVSPDNPTGAVWRERELGRLVEACTIHNGVLVVDHCFLLAGLHDPVDISPSWLHVDEASPVIAIWDTGKTVDLAGSKLGFAITSNPILSRELEAAMSVLQYKMADHTVDWISSILRSPNFPTLVDELRSVMRSNQAILNSIAEMQGFGTFGTRAGAFELVSGVLDQTKDVGTVNLREFRDVDSDDGRSWVRVALGRPLDYFSAAVSKLKVSL